MIKKPVIGSNTIRKEASSLLQEVMRGFSCEVLLDNQKLFEETFQTRLQK